MSVPEFLLQLIGSLAMPVALVIVAVIIRGMVRDAYEQDDEK